MNGPRRSHPPPPPAPAVLALALAMPLVRLHCTPAVEPNACVVHAMGGLLPAAPTLTFDDTIGAAKMPVRFRERLETDDLHAELWPTVAGSEPPPDTAALVLGHQQDARGAMPCPATASVAQPPAPRLAAVALAMDPVRQCVLLTRRPRSMRTFPGAWVLPGGSVDATDGSTAAAALRELAEETGLAASEAVGAVPFCLWESCYPPSFELWREKQEAGGRCSHFVICYHKVAVDSRQPLELQPEECDCAVWVPLHHLAGPLAGRDAGAEAASESYERAAGSPAGEPVPASLLTGVYPNALGEGVGRAHLFAISQLGQRDGQ